MTMTTMMMMTKIPFQPSLEVSLDTSAELSANTGIPGEWQLKQLSVHCKVILTTTNIK